MSGLDSRRSLPPSKRILRELENHAVIVLQSTVTCPYCGHQATEPMPENACSIKYDCKGCGARLQPAAGDCCVFCTYGTIPCPPIQRERIARTSV